MKGRRRTPIPVRPAATEAKETYAMKAFLIGVVVMVAASAAAGVVLTTYDMSSQTVYSTAAVRH